MSARYRAIYRDGRLFAEYENGMLTYLDPGYMAPKRSDKSAPMVMRDIGEYRSPIDGSMITSRSQHRDHKRAHGVEEVGNEPIGKIAAMREANTPKVDKELGLAIKRRLEEVEQMPQAQYDEYVQKQVHEHAQVAALPTATVTE